MTWIRFFFLVILLMNFGFTRSYAQAGYSIITLKNGTEIKGIVKSIDPVGDIVVSLAGNDVSLKMADVIKIDGANNEDFSENEKLKALVSKYEKIQVTDKSDYPESFDLKVGEESLKMILVRGGDMNMGYDGDHSVAMKSEPIHRVGVTTFYISETVVTNAFVASLEGKKVKNGFYHVNDWKYANDVARSVARTTKMMVRLPSEAEWEYAACSDEKEKIFANANFYEYCSDLYDRFQDVDYEVDPVGPQHSIFNCHVVRSYYLREGVFDRSGYKTDKGQIYFRLVIKAKDVKR